MSVEEPRTVRPLKTTIAPATTKTTHLLRLVSAHKGKQKGQVTEEARDDMELQKGRPKASQGSGQCTLLHIPGYDLQGALL